MKIYSKSLPQKEIVRLLSEYFIKRGSFLANVIRADIQSLDYLSEKNPSQELSTQLHIHEDEHNYDENENLNNKTNGLDTNFQQNVPESLSSTSQKSSSQSIEEVVLNIVAERTSFPVNSLSLDLRLLDDLNLDSIKTGELVAKIAQKLGLEGIIDPSNFANASLTEIIDSFTKQNQINQPQTQVSSEVISEPNSSSQNSTQDSSLIWVRDFAVEYVPEDAPLILDDQEENWETANFFEQDNWNTANVLIVAESEEQQWCEAMKKALEFQGATVEIVDYQKVDTLSLIQNPKYTHYLGILPTFVKGEMTPEARLLRAMKRLRALATPLKAEQINRNYITVAYLQFGGGYFGKLPQMNDFEQCATIGFAASLYLERRDLKVRIIDLPVNINPDKLTANIINELSRPEAYLAVGYDQNLTRRIPRPRIQDRSLYLYRPIDWSNEDVFLITGGAKGITAECALALARLTGVSVALVGSSPSPQDAPTTSSSQEIAHTLRRFKQEGLNCQYYQCNVTKGREIVNLINQVENDLGKITGVIHGAALNKPRRVENCNFQEAYQEVSPKVLGVLNIMEALKNKPPKLFVGFSSIGGVIGLPANTWYGFSNEALDLILRRFGEQHPETSVLAIAFSVWLEIGMGAKMGTVSNLNRMGVEAMPTDEGVSHFVKLITCEPKDSQIVVTAKLGGVETMHRGFDTWRTERYAPPTNFKFIDDIRNIELGVEIVARTRLTLERDSYVQDHIYKGSYLFPTVFGLEAMAQAAVYAAKKDNLSSIHLENISLERPIVVDPDKGVEIEIIAQVLERKSAQDPLKVRTEIRTERTGFTTAHFAATVIFDEKDAMTMIKPIKISKTPLELNPQDLYSWLQFQGPRFQRLQTAYVLNSQGFIYRTHMDNVSNYPNSSDRADGPFLLGDPYYRDSLLQSVQPIIPQDLCLPIGIDHLKIYQLNPSINGSCLGISKIQERKDKQYNATVLTVNEENQIIEKLEGYRLQIVEHKSEHPTAEELAKSIKPDQEMLSTELNRRAENFNMVPPVVTITKENGLHEISKKERHEREIPVFSKTLDKLINSDS